MARPVKVHDPLPSVCSMICRVLFACSQVLELTKEWTNKWNETQNILKVRRVVLAHSGLCDAEL